MRSRISVVAILLVVAATAPVGLGRTIDAHAAGVLRGIDVSAYQGPAIAWHSVAASGISFAYIRAADGAGSPDGTFAGNWRGATSAGVTPGAYLFFEPAQSPIAQANLLVAQLRSVGFTRGDLVPDDRCGDHRWPAPIRGGRQSANRRRHGERRDRVAPGDLCVSVVVERQHRLLRIHPRSTVGGELVRQLAVGPGEQLGRHRMAGVAVQRRRVGARDSGKCRPRPGRHPIAAVLRMAEPGGPGGDQCGGRAAIGLGPAW